jgi:hypothetical protein
MILVIDFQVEDLKILLLKLKKLILLILMFRYTIQVVDPDTYDTQLTELVLQTTTLDSILFEKYTAYTNQLLGEFQANVDISGRKTLIFTPFNRFTRDHDIKVLKKTFSSSETGSGIGTNTIGSINLNRV